MLRDARLAAMADRMRHFEVVAKVGSGPFLLAQLVPHLRENRPFTRSVWARTSLSPLRNCRSVLNRRTASAVRRHGSDVDPFSDAQGIF